jgi:hypothetical protein
MAIDHVKKFLGYSIPGRGATDFQSRTTKVAVWFEKIYLGNNDPILAELHDKGIDPHEMWGATFKRGDYKSKVKVPGISPEHEVEFFPSYFHRGIDHYIPFIDAQIAITDPETMHKHAKAIFQAAVDEYWPLFEDNFQKWSEDAMTVQKARKAIGLENFLELAGINLTQVPARDRQLYVDALKQALSVLPDVKGAVVREISPEEYFLNNACGLCYEDGQLAVQIVDFHRGGLVDFRESIKTLAHEVAHFQVKDFDQDPEATNYQRRLSSHGAPFQLQLAKNLARIDTEFCQGYFLKARTAREEAESRPEPRDETPKTPTSESTTSTDKHLIRPEWGL